MHGEEDAAPVCPGALVARVPLRRVVSRAVTEHAVPGPGLYLLAGGGAAVITPHPAISLHRTTSVPHMQVLMSEHQLHNTIITLLLLNAYLIVFGTT